jgi:hydrogenase maturation protease
LEDIVKKPVLVLGIGNILMNDEGVGIAVVAQLEREGVEDADMVDGGTGGVHLLEILQSYQTVIVVDASLDDYPPGHVRVLHPRFASEFPTQLSAHEFGLRDLIITASVTGYVPEMHLVAISVKNFQRMGMEISDPVRAAIPEAIRAVRELIGEGKRVKG